MPDELGGDKLGALNELPTLEQIEAAILRKKRNRFSQWFPDLGPYRRELYPKHIEFFNAGLVHRERLFMAANRVGKTICGGYESTAHLTGNYPPWWRGRVFEEPVVMWACNTSAPRCRDVNQLELLGQPRQLGTGMIPGDLVIHTKPKPSVPDGIEILYVRHKSGGQSVCYFKCHPASSRVLMADGSWRRINKVRIGDLVGCPDGKSRPVKQLHAYAESPTLRVKTRSGIIEATPNHPFYVVNRGWVECADLNVGDVLEVAYREPDTKHVEDWLVKMTALMIGDGCTRGKTPFFTCNEPEIVAEVASALPSDLYLVPISNTISYKISSTMHKRNRLKESLEADGIWNVKSKHKHIPDWVFGLPRAQRITFLNWLWGCDGHVKSNSASYTTASKKLAEDMRLLLWSVGIYASVSEHDVTNQSRKVFHAYYLSLSGENRILFSDIGKLNRDNEHELDVRRISKAPRGEILQIMNNGKQDVYCVGVDDVHELIVDGYRVGNSYDQGAEKFESSAVHCIWDDEEVPSEVYAAQLLRTMTTSGILYLTFTPVLGLTATTCDFLQNCINKQDLPLECRFSNNDKNDGRVKVSIEM